MAIEKKTCLCGCGRKFYGTARRKFAKDYCRVKWNRKKDLKSKADKEEIEQLKVNVDFESEC